MEPNQVKYLLQLASEASECAYAPYSNFKVGACALYEDGSVYKGCNVENASYGLTTCAERNAISNAVISGNKSKLKAIAIYSPDSKLCYPCGACRQWIVEFSKDATIILQDLEENPVIYSIQELLPKAFEL
jgi:cytidine deaminase